MKVTADRIEGDFIIVELPAGETVNMPRSLAPEAREGDVISICIDSAETENRLKNAEKRLKSLFDR